MTHGVLIRLSPGYPPTMDRLHTCYAPVRRSPPKYCYSALPLDLHVLGLSLAFILSQDQTLRCKINYKSVLCPKRSIVVYLISHVWLIHSLMESTRTVCHPPLFLIIYIRCHHCGCFPILVLHLIDQSLKELSRSATQSHRMPLGGIKAMRASALPMRNLAISVGTLDFKELPLRA